MKFGLFCIMASPHGDHRREMRELLEQAELAEELGYDSIWLAEHHSAYGIMGNPAVTLAAIAQRTSRIRLGTAIAVLPFQNPLRIAEDYAMVDVLSNGRLDFGAGRGSQWLEYQLMRADRDHSKEVFWEALDIILALWNTPGKISYHGQHFQFDEIETFPKPVQKPIPVWVAAVSPDTFPKCAERGLQVMTAGVGEWEEFRERTLGAATVLVEKGFAPEALEFPHSLLTHIGPSNEEARARFVGPMWNMHLLTPFSPFGSVPAAVKDFEHYKKMNEGLLKHGTGESLFDEARAKRHTMVSDSATARDFLRQLRDEVGVNHYIAAMNVGGLDHKLVVESMRRFAEEVIPEFRDTHTSPALVASRPA